MLPRSAGKHKSTRPPAIPPGVVPAVLVAVALGICAAFYWGASVASRLPPPNPIPELKLRPGEDLPIGTSMSMTTIRSGDGRSFPTAGTTVRVHYTGSLLSGDEFESTIGPKKPFEFKLGEGKVVRCWEEALLAISLSQHVLLVCAPDYAYGKAGHPPHVPSNATIVFELELLAIL